MSDMKVTPNLISSHLKSRTMQHGNDVAKKIEQDHRKTELDTPERLTHQPF